ncbi:MAG: hypothetical protein JXQ96_13915 [Cyclobacteriaceae bacterium]
MLNYLTLLFICLSGFSAHDFHISVCEIEFDENSKALEMTHRLFINDLEEALRDSSDGGVIDILNTKDEQSLGRMIENYLFQRFRVGVNGKENELRFVGFEPEGDVVYCYMEIVNVRKLKSISVMNKILMEKFDDQMNLLRIYNKEQTVTKKFSKEATTLFEEFEN